MLTSTQRSLYDNTSPFEDMHKHLHQKRGVLKCVYDFDDLGGAVGTIGLLDDLGNKAILPDNAIITQVYVDILTAFTSTGNNGTIALTANSSGDLLAAVDADTLSGVSAGIPDGAAANMVKLTAQRQITLAIATNAITAGAANFFVEFVLSD